MYTQSAVVKHFVELRRFPFNYDEENIPTAEWLKTAWEQAKVHEKPIYATLIPEQSIAQGILEGLGFEFVACCRNLNTGRDIHLLVWLPKKCSVTYKAHTMVGMPYCCGGKLSCMHALRIRLPRSRDAVHLFAAAASLSLVARKRFGLKQLAKYKQFSVWVLKEQFDAAKAKIEAR